MQPVPGPDAVRKANFEAFRKWLKANRAAIEPDREIAIFYAGDFINMGELGKLAKAHDRKDDEMGPHIGRIWTYVKEMTDNPVGRKARYASIDTALAACRKAPPLFDPLTAKKVLFANMKDYAHAAGSTRGDAAFFAEADRKAMWTMLSAVYAENTKGEIMIFAEFTRNYENFKKNSDLVHTELKALLANRKLPDSAKRQVVAYVRRYIDAYGDKAKVMMKAIEKAEAEMKARPKGA